MHKASRRAFKRGVNFRYVVAVAIACGENLIEAGGDALRYTGTIAMNQGPSYFKIRIRLRTSRKFIVQPTPIRFGGNSR